MDAASTERLNHCLNWGTAPSSELGPPVEGRAPERLELLDVSCASFSTPSVCDQANTALGQMLGRC